MVIEGERAGTEMNKLLPNGGKIIELSGTTGSGAATGRAEGFRKTLAKISKLLPLRLVTSPVPKANR